MSFRSARPLAAALTLALLATAACGGDDAVDPPATADAAPVADADPLAPDAAPPVPDEALVGGLYLAEVAGEPAYAVIQARFGDAPLPRFLTEADTAGACTLWVREPTQCMPECEGFCVGDFMCRPFPRNAGAGDLTVTGTTRPLTLRDLSDYYELQGEYPTDLFAPGASITLRAAGGDVPAFTLVETAPAPLVGGPAADELDLNGDGDVRVTWTPADPGGRVRLVLNANSSGGHGSPYAAVIQCEVDDAVGEITVARALLDAFPETFRWEICAGRDCPLSELTRYRRATATAGDGVVGLTLAAKRSFFILHAAP